MAKLVLNNITSGYATHTLQNSNNDLIEAALENTLSRDGTTPNTMGVDLDMNNHRVINLAAPSHVNDAARLQDVQNAVVNGVPNSAIIPFIQAGTGAVERTVQDKNREIVSVKDFGAVGDGITDDTAAIQEAINYCSTNGYELYVPPGTYRGNWTTPTDTIISGSSRGDVIFTPMVNSPVFKVNTTTSTVRLNFRHFTILGDVTKPLQDGISLAPTTAATFVDTISLQDLSIYSCGRHGIHTYGSSAFGPFVQNLSIKDVVIQGCIKEGMYAEGDAFEWVFYNLWITNCGDATVPSATFGSKTSAGHAPNRVIWIGGGLNHLTPALLQRYVTDLVTTAASANASSATANFTAADEGKAIAIHNGNTQSHPLITTILTVVNATDIILNTGALVSNAGGTKAIIQWDKAGAVNIIHAKQIKFISCDFESAGVYITVSGSLQQDFSYDNCRFGGSSATLATVMSLDTGGSGIAATNSRVGNTVAHFYNYLSATATGAIQSLVSQTKNISFPPLDSEVTISNMVMYDIQTIGTNTLKIYQPFIKNINVAGGGTLNYLYDKDGGTKVLTRGAVYVLFATAGFTVNHSTTPGNIFTKTGAAVVLATNGSMQVMWNESASLWYEI